MVQLFYETNKLLLTVKQLHHSLNMLLWLIPKKMRIVLVLCFKINRGLRVLTILTGFILSLQVWCLMMIMKFVST